MCHQWFPRARRGAWILLVTLLLASHAGFAQSGGKLRGWGPRAGVSADPDQIYVGAHFDLGSLTSRLRVQPNLELGFGDDLTVLATNLEVDYRLRSDWRVWTPYLGGGLGVVTTSHDQGLFHGANRSELGLTGLLGLERMQGNYRFFMEAKVGFVDTPDLKVGLGWTFF